MNTEFIEALEELEREKRISMDVLLEALEAALISAYKRNFGSLQNVRVHIDRHSGEIKVYARKNVVETVEDDRVEISLEEARKKDPRYEIGDVVEIEVTPRDFGRIAAQTAKQVVVQRIREAERGIIYEEFSNREGDIVTGIVQRQDQRNVYIDLGKTEAILGPTEQIPGEEYKHGDRLKTYIVEVKKTTKGPQILVSRTHPGLLKRLFELEVPEIHDGIVELKSVAREAGARSKIAVYSRDENVDPVGACVGPKGMRVQTIVAELKGEKIDIVKWHQDPAKFVANALSPAKVVSVTIFENEKMARVVVPDYQLSLAIGKEGQNARLAAKLTGWKIDIKSESQVEELIANGQWYTEEDYQDSDYAAEDYFEGEYTEEDYSDYDYAEGDYDGEYAEGDYDGEYAEGDYEYAEGDYDYTEGDYDGEYAEGDYDGEYAEGDYDGEYAEGDYDGEYAEGDYDGEYAEGDYDGEYAEGDYGGEYAEGDYDDAYAEGDYGGAYAEGDYDDTYAEGECSEEGSDGDRREGDYSEDQSYAYEEPAEEALPEPDDLDDFDDYDLDLDEEIRGKGRKAKKKGKSGEAGKKRKKTAQRKKFTSEEVNLFLEELKEEE